MSEKDSKKPGPRPVAELVPTALRPSQTAVRDRLLADPFLVDTDAEGPRLYQHSVLCQTSMPYRDPGEQRIWQRQNGFVHLEIQAGRAFIGSQDGFVDVGLPFGPKPRLVLYHLNAEAMRTQSPIIELEDSLTAFVKRTLGLDPGGRNIRTVKEQLTRLSAADFRLGTSIDGRPITVKGSVVEGFDLWTSRNPHQRVLWPTTVQFSLRYFDSLMKHAVPLNETAVARLSHSAMALDAYTWLAQRLHRVPEGKTELVPWASLWQQFGHGYERVRDFRRVFAKTLSQVMASYPEAKFDLDDQGISLRRSRPPTARRLLPMFPDAAS
jgi:Plasmid encoded RepA protein